MPAKKTAPASAEAVQVPSLNIQRLFIRVVGDSSLISHAWSAKSKRMMLDAQMKRARGPKAAKDPFRDFVESLYWLDEANYAPPSEVTTETWNDVVRAARFGMPSTAFKSAIVDAATFLDTHTKVALRGSLHLVGEMVHIIGSPTIREDTVRIGMGTADLRYRAEFLTWSAMLTIDHNPNVISTQQIAHLVNVAGFACGIGDWRPGRDGSHGRFRAE
jgi:hypothetical protein